MLNTNRSKFRRVFTISLIGVIALTFAVMGLGSYFAGKGDYGTAAVVNGQKISWAAVNTLYERVRRTMSETAQHNEKMMKEQLRFAMVQRLALLNNAKALGFQLSDAQLADALVKMPAFQKEGSFSKDQYLQVLSNAAYTDKEFRQELSNDLLIAQLEQGLSQSNFSLASELSRLVSLIDQKRDVGYFILPASKLRAQIKIEPNQIQEYYEKNKANFISPEQVSLEYISLSAEELAKGVDVSPEILESYYEKHKASYTIPESFRVRHILISVPQLGSGQEAEQQAKETVTRLSMELKKGASFEKLAEAHSMDQSTAKAGGDIGWFVRGQMVPEFENAVVALKKPNEISEPIRTQFGYHLIQLSEKKAPEIRLFKDIQSLVKEQFQKEEAQKLFLDKFEQMEKLAFEHSDSLKPISEQLDLKLESTDFFSRLSGQTDITRHPEVLKTAFSVEVLEHKHNSQPIKINDSLAIVLRRKDHKPAEQQTLAQVEKNINEILITEKSKQKAKEWSEVLVQKLKNHEDPESLAKTYLINFVVKKNLSRDTKGIDQSIVTAAFQAKKPTKEDKEPILESRPLPNGDYLVLILQKVQEGEIDKLDLGMRAAYKQGLADLLSQLEFGLYSQFTFSQAKTEFPIKNP